MGVFLSEAEKGENQGLFTWGRNPGEFYEHISNQAQISLK